MCLKVKSLGICQHWFLVSVSLPPGHQEIRASETRILQFLSMAPCPLFLVPCGLVPPSPVIQTLCCLLSFLTNAQLNFLPQVTGKSKNTNLFQCQDLLKPCSQNVQPQGRNSFLPALSNCPPAREPKAKKNLSHFCEGLMLDK